ncbi:MAG: hypothetical protein PUK86_08820 [bacterium]|nr:hypothetical protein [bacterium]
MASQYYGLRGSLVKDYQQKLNSLGANLQVDGIWGKKTERAYNLFMDEFNDLVNGRTQDEEPEEELPTQQAYEFTPRTEQQLADYAEKMYGAAYDERLRAAEKSANARAASTQAMIEALTPLYEQQLASLSQQYHSGREYLSNQALSRGLGRSTYLTDQLAGSVSRQRADENTLLSQMNSRQSALQDQIRQLYSDLDDQRASITGQREQAIWEAIENGRRQDQEQQFKALQYNNSLIKDARDYAEKQRQFEEELKIKRASALNKR